MIEIYHNLFVGNDEDFTDNKALLADWSIIQAAKYPYHRDAVGYTGQAAPKSSPEYLVARRDNRLILNLIDADTPKYISAEAIDAALQFTHAALNDGDNVLILCNQGLSRAPSIALLYLARYTDAIPKASFAKAREAFEQLYPDYYPSWGMWGFLNQNWQRYMRRS
ncbi:MAG: protein-tyrosine phosphatase family protein [Armatimonadota bacterium]